MKKLSIIVVSYNEAAFIGEALDSILTQACDFDYEIIVGDDGSTDGSLEIIEAYEKSHPDVIRHFVMDRGDTRNLIPSLRVSNLMKRGFSMSRGTYCAALSGDDLFLKKDGLQQQVDFLDRHPAYASCYTDFKKFGPNQEDKVCRTRGSLSRGAFWGVHYVHLSCFVFRKEVLGCLLDRFCDDTGLLFSILKTGKTRHLSILSFGYRQRDASIMHEADPLELSILELMLYQDVLNAGGFSAGSLARFSLPLKYAYLHRKDLENEKYQKYRSSCKGRNCDLLSELAQYDSLDKKTRRRIRRSMRMGAALRKGYSLRRKLRALLSFGK